MHLFAMWSIALTKKSYQSRHLVDKHNGQEKENPRQLFRKVTEEKISNLKEKGSEDAKADRKEATKGIKSKLSVETLTSSEEVITSKGESLSKKKDEGSTNKKFTKDQKSKTSILD